MRTRLVIFFVSINCVCSFVVVCCAMWKNLKASAYGARQSIVTSIQGPPSVSSYETTGYLTPQEFVSAGDELVHKFGTWKWAKGDPSKRCPYMTDDKQYLLMRGAFSDQRVEDIHRGFEESEDENGWVQTSVGHIEARGDSGGQIPDTGQIPDIGRIPDIGQIPDIEDLGDDVMESGHESRVTEEDGCIIIEEEEAEGGSGIAHDPKFRWYDISITYDVYHYCPRMWLFGYDHARAPLTPDEMMEDISATYAHKTVTVEPHPHLKNINNLSIHPCRHAEVLKSLSERSKAAGTPIPSRLSLVLFLKFMGAVIPTIDHDCTTDISVRTSRKSKK
jgi:ubiquitin-like-conjugating enzyme ATG3